MNIKTRFIKIYEKQFFHPNWLMGIWLNPFFITRNKLMQGIEEMALDFKGGLLLDIGCGSKPYEDLFNVKEYVGIDIEVSGHDHVHSKIDKFYDGKNIPYQDEHFDWIFSSEVFEHVFNLEELLEEIHRVTKKGGQMGFTCPFIWDIHEEPYDYARYTPHALEYLMNKKGFEVVKIKKSSNHLETIFQIITSYFYLYVLPKNTYLRLILVPIFIAPLNIIGILLGKIFKDSGNFYHNNIVVVKKK